MINIFQKTWREIDLEIANRMVGIRKRKKISQKELAKRSGVSLGSIKRFEQNGEISLKSLTQISIALGMEEELDSLFSDVQFDSIEEIINGQNK